MRTLVDPCFTTLIGVFVPVATGLVTTDGDTIWRISNGAVFLGHGIGFSIFLFRATPETMTLNQKVGGVLTTATLVTTLGSALGVYLIGTLGDQTGSLAKTLLGSSLGMGTAYLLNEFVVENGLLFLALAPVGATLAFNLSRRYEQPMGMGMTLSLNKQRRMRLFVTGHQVSF